jgi:hypothetical protein
MGFSLSKLNPVKAIDNALVGLDKGVKNVGGWEVVGPAAAALIAAPYLAPELFAAEGLAGGTAAGTGLTGGAGATGLTAGATGAAGGLTVPLSSIQAASGLGLGAAGTAGLTASQQAMLLRGGVNALNQMTGGAKIGGDNSMGGTGGGSSYNYANMPYLANPQNNQTYMKTGADVSGSGVTTAGMPVQLDTTRHNILMANLLRG